MSNDLLVWKREAVLHVLAWHFTNLVSAAPEFRRRNLLSVQRLMPKVLASVKYVKATLPTLVVQVTTG